MPQMAPSMWLFLMIFFFVIFMGFNILNYFFKFPSPKIETSTSIMPSSLTWKW